MAVESAVVAVKWIVVKWTAREMRHAGARRMRRSGHSVTSMLCTTRRDHDENERKQHERPDELLHHWPSDEICPGGVNRCPVDVARTLMLDLPTSTVSNLHAQQTNCESDAI